jgi:signal transduction histidine kinase
MAAVDTSSFNLGPRLTFTFAALVVLILGGNALVVWQFHSARNETDRLTGANQQLIAVLQLQANLLSLHRRLDDLARSTDLSRLVTEGESLRGTVREQTQQTRTAIANLPSETVVDPSFLATLDTIDVTLPAEIEAIVELARSGNWGAIQGRMNNELNPIETQTAILVNGINEQASRELARGVTKMSSAERRILIVVPATALATFFIAAFFGWSIARRFIQLRLEERVIERLRIARELHDTLLQSFQGVILHLHALTFILDRPAEVSEKLEGTCKGGLLLDCAPATVEAKAVQRRVRMFVRITGIPLESLNYLNRLQRGRTRFI